MPSFAAFLNFINYIGERTFQAYPFNNRKEESMRGKTITEIRKSPNPLFVAVASTKANVAIAAFQDGEHGALFISQTGDDGKAFSPLSGKSVENLSVGELAASPAEFKDLTIAGKCAKKKCGCTMYVTPAIASILQTAKEKTVYCTACGTESPLTFAKAAAGDDAGSDDTNTDDDDTVDDSVGDDDADDDSMVDDDDSDSDTDEDAASDDDSGDDSDDDSDDSGDSDDADADADSDADSDSDDTDADSDDAEDDSEDDEGTDPSEDEDDKEIDGEVASLLAELAEADGADEEKPADAADTTKPGSEEAPNAGGDETATLSYAMHRLADLKTGKSFMRFIDTDTAFLTHAGADGQERHLGTFSRMNASPESAKLFDNRKVFGSVASQLINQGALAGEQPSDELAKMGFKAISIELPLSVAQAEMAKAAIAAAETAVRDEASSKLQDVSNNFAKLVALAAVGVNKGMLGNASFYKELATALHGYGIRQADKVAQKLCESKLKPFLANVIEQATALSQKDASYVTGIADTVNKSQYASLDNEADQEQVSTSVHGDDNNEIVVASFAEHANQAALTPSKIQSALRRIGRQGL